jgi:CDP-glycerol glycerophosphotransferase (TagB/SpsB family)
MEETRLRFLESIDPAIRYNFQLYKGLPSISLHRAILHWSRKARLSLNSPFNNGRLPRDYVFMTLHVQPEASTSVLAPFFANQRHVIENVARALPLHWRLVVKPHPLMIGLEPVEFYRHVQKIPNVQLISPTADTRQLILGSKVVVAITGTSGFEALLLGKKVIVFGKPIWSLCHSVSTCTDFTHLHGLLRDADGYEPDDNDLAAFLQAVHDNSFPLKRNYVWKGPYDLSDLGYSEAIDESARQLVNAYRAYQGSRV